MADSLFDTYRSEAIGAGVKLRTDDSIKWFRQQLSQLQSVNRRGILKDPNMVKKNRPRVGSMYMYFYDPKTRETLPYYDAFPLVIMVEPAPGGFYGINLHYLPPVLRAKMLDGLLQITNNKKYDESTRMRLSYDLLKGSSKLRYFAPCFKRYLYSQIEASPVMVDAADWEIAVFLPTEQFRKAKKGTVWKDSRGMI